MRKRDTLDIVTMIRNEFKRKLAKAATPEERTAVLDEYYSDLRKATSYLRDGVAGLSRLASMASMASDDIALVEKYDNEI